MGVASAGRPRNYHHDHQLSSQSIIIQETAPLHMYPPSTSSPLPDPTIALSRTLDSPVSPPLPATNFSSEGPHLVSSLLSPDSDYEIVDAFPPVEMGNVASQIELPSFTKGGRQDDPCPPPPDLYSHPPIATNTPRIPLIQISSTGSTPGSRSHRRHRSTTVLDPIVPPTRNELQQRDKEKLMRTARKVGKVLGETPVLAMVDKRNMKMVELDIIPGPIEEVRSGGVKLKSGALKFGRANGGKGPSFHPFASPSLPHSHRHRHHLPTPPSSAPANLRAPPVLKVDCNMVNKSQMFKRRRSDSASMSPDASGSANISSVSTNLTFDLLSPASPPRVRRSRHNSPRSPRSPRSPPSTTSSLSRSLANLPLSDSSPDGVKGKGKERALTVDTRRSKMAKLARHLGDYVPNELVFPPTLDTSSSSSTAVPTPGEPPVLTPPTSTTHGESKIAADEASSSPKVAKSERGARRKGMVMVEGIELGLAVQEAPDAAQSHQTASTSLTKELELSAHDASTTNLPPQKPSLTKRRKRVSLYLDVGNKRNSTRASRSARSPSIGMPFFSSSKSSGGSRHGTLPRSVRQRAPKTPYPPRMPLDVRVDEEKLAFALADVSNEMDEEWDVKPRLPLSDKRKSINVRRVAKMTRMFGTPPSTEVLALQTQDVDDDMEDDEDDEAVLLAGTARESSLSLFIDPKAELLSAVRAKPEFATPQIITTPGRSPRSSEDSEEHPLTSKPEKQLTLDMSSVTAFVDLNSKATSKSPVTPKKPVAEIRESVVQFAVEPKRRRNSCSSIPPTPPPFAQYFNLPTAKAPAIEITSAAPSALPPTPHTPPSTNRLKRASRHRPSPSTPSALPSQSLSPSKTSPSFSNGMHIRRPEFLPYSVAIPAKQGEPSPNSKGKNASTSPLHPSSSSPTTHFRERRVRAAKLAKFFGVGYGELFPPPMSSTRPIASSNSTELQRQQQLAKKKSNVFEGVSVTVQQSVWHDEDLHPSTSTVTTKTLPSRNSKLNSDDTPRPSEDIGEAEWEFGLRLSRGASRPSEESEEKAPKANTMTLGRKVSRRLRAMKA